MVKVEKDYGFEGPNGKPSLKDLFEAAANSSSITSLFDPAWDKGCSGCTGFVNALGDLSLLDKCDTKFVVVSRAPLAKLDAIKPKRDGLLRGSPRLAATSITIFT